MINMVRADLYRAFKSIAIYVAFGIALLLMGVSIYMCEPGMISTTLEMNGEAIVPELDSPVNRLSLDEYSDMTVSERRSYIRETGGYELDRDMMGTNMNLYYVFIFVALIIITADFSSGAVKNTLSSAVSRRNYFISKATAAFAVSILIFFANVYLTYFLNRMVNGAGLSSDLWTMTRTAFLQLPVILAIISILIGFAFMLKKTALYNIVAIPFAMVCQMVFALGIRLLDLSEDLMDYDFQCMFSTLVGQPTESYMTKCYILCGAVCVIFLAAGWLSFRRAEI